MAVFDRVLTDPSGRIEYHYVLLDFVCECPDGTPIPSSDVLDCAFVQLDKLGEYSMTECTEGVIRRAFSRDRGHRDRIYDPGR